MDKSKEERAGGFSIHPAWRGFQTSLRRFTMIDNPGHKDFVKNSIHGIYHADFVLLLTSAMMSENEIAELDQGQAENHLLTAFCFGVRTVVIVVNKMDLITYDKVEYDKVCQFTIAKVKRAGFKEDQCITIPVSTLENEGILSSSDKMGWYSGPCLMQVMDEVELPKHRQGDRVKPFRLVVSEVCKTNKHSSKSVVVCGKVERGTIAVGDSVSIAPLGPVDVKVLAIHSIGNTSIASASAGEDVGVELSITNPCYVKAKDAYPLSLETGGSSSAAAGGGATAPSVAKAKSLPSGASTKKLAEYQVKIRRGMIIGLGSSRPIGVMTHFEAQIYLGREFIFSSTC
jgi:translation elongation factor EF-1alpha